MISPDYLKPGDTIGIIAPASYITENEITNAVRLIRNNGFNVVFGRNIFKRVNSFAGTDHERADDFQMMMEDSSVKAILSARGGYGSLRTAERLNFKNFLLHPKWIIGCSDITVFHSIINKAGIESIHSVMPRGIREKSEDIESLNSLINALTGNLKEYYLPYHQLNINGESSGELSGGNLSVLYSLIGSKYEPDLKDKILFIEDVGEYLYQIERMITNLKNANKLQQLKGIIAGGMNRMKISGSGFRTNAYNIIKKASAEYGFPVIFGMPAGHVRPNKALIMGRNIKIKANNNGVLIKFE